MNLRRVDARHLFKPSDVSVILRRHSHLRNYMFDFIRMFASRLERSIVEDALFRKNAPALARGSLPEM